MYTPVEARLQYAMNHFCVSSLSIQAFYDNVSSAITRSAKLCIPMRKNKMTKKLGWKDELKILKRASNKDYSTWMAVVKPRHGLLYGSMLKSRKQFKTRLKS